jgi:hypothetical protein
MGTFTAVLGTLQCRPGNIVLATKFSNSAILATAALLGFADVTATGKAQHTSSVDLMGVSAVVAAGKGHHATFSSLIGASAVVATSLDEDSSACALLGRAVFFIDPTKVLTISFFTPSGIPVIDQGGHHHPPRQYQQGLPLRSSKLINAPSLKPKKTRSGGVPNEG